MPVSAAFLSVASHVIVLVRLHKKKQKHKKKLISIYFKIIQQLFKFIIVFTEHSVSV